MFSPWQMQAMRQMHPARQMRPMTVLVMPMTRRAPLMQTPSGGFPVPEAIKPEQLPPKVRESMMRVLEGPPKPVVTRNIMNQTQESMIAPDLPWKADV